MNITTNELAKILKASKPDVGDERADSDVFYKWIAWRSVASDFLVYFVQRYSREGFDALEFARNCGFEDNFDISLMREYHNE